MGFRLYEIDGAIQDILDRCAVDPDTGEVAEDWEGFRPDMDAALDALHYDRERIVLYLGAKVKEYDLLADAIKAETKRLRARAATLENQSERLKNYIRSNIPEGQKYEDGRVKLSWRKSVGVLIRDMSALPDRLVKVERTPMLAEIKKELKEHELPGAELEKRNNLVIR